MEKSNVSIFETSQEERSTKFKTYLETYVPNFNEMEYHEQVKELKRMKKGFENNMKAIGKRYGFDSKKLITPLDNGMSHKLGDYFVASENLYEKEENLKKLKTPGNIVILKRDNPGIAVGYSVSDDPVVIMEDQEKGITALAHCGIKQITQRIPLYMIKAMQKEAGSNIKNIKVYISSNLKKENNKVIFRPKEIKNNPEVWKGQVKRSHKLEPSRGTIEKVINITKFLTEKSINQEGAITKMLIQRGINPESITINNKNTYTNPNLFSKTKAKDLHEKELEGSYLVRAYYEDTFPEYKAEPRRTRKLR